MLKVYLTAEIHPSEDPEKVKKAVMNVVDPKDEAKVELMKDMIRVEASENTIKKILQAVKDKDVVPLMLRLLNEGKKGDKFYLMLNKQAAYVGHIVMCDDPRESPLGPINVEFDSEAIQFLLANVRNKSYS